VTVDRHIVWNGHIFAVYENGCYAGVGVLIESPTGDTILYSEKVSRSDARRCDPENRRYPWTR
jgi:hypothetical protein